MKLGVFDSGIGGKAIAESLARDFPQAEIMYVHDSEHVPYGGREQKEIIALTDAAIQPLLEGACDVIVIACNTATAAAIEVLRTRYPKQKFIGLEPMVKPAAELTKTGIIAICATPYTLQSNRYRMLKEAYADGVEVLEPDCSEWATMIEHDALDLDLLEKEITTVIERHADVIVLACTHYHWIEERIIALADGKATIINPSDAISRRVAALLNIA